MTQESDIKKLFQAFNVLKVLVIGDVMLDKYVYGDVDRISPEAPVPVVLVNKTEERPGGAANVAMNIKAMGADAILIGVLGKDHDSESLIDLLKINEINVKNLIKSEERLTTTKTRIISKQNQMMRLDHEILESIVAEEEELIINNAKKIIENEKPHVVIFEDYNKGALTEKIIREVTRMCLNNNIPVAVDPKRHHFFAYQVCTLFKPNLRELKDNLNMEFNVDDKVAIQNAVKALHQKIHNGITMVTMSDKGIYLNSGEVNIYEEAHVRNIADVSGAGDTVISVASLCLAAKANLAAIAKLSNLAGGIVCEHSGVVPINKEILMQEAIEYGI